MRILSIGNFGTGWDGSICDEEHIAQALEELGHEVIRASREQFSFSDCPHYSISADECDFVLISQWDGYGKLSSRIPIIYWAFDYQADGQEWHEQLVKEADLYLSKRIADSKYPNWRWLSQDFAPDFLYTTRQPHEKWETEIDVLFTGSYLSWADERNEILKAVNDKFKLVIHSVNEWPKEWGLDVRPPVMDKGLPELYSTAKVILSIDHTIEAGYWSDRNAQIMACGFRPLFKYVPLSESTFHDYVDYFYGTKDCLVKIDKRLREPARLSNSYRFAQENLKVLNRVKDLLTIVEDIL